MEIHCCCLNSEVARCMYPGVRALCSSLPDRLIQRKPTMVFSLPLQAWDESSDSYIATDDESLENGGIVSYTSSAVDLRRSLTLALALCCLYTELGLRTWMIDCPPYPHPSTAIVDVAGPGRDNNGAACMHPQSQTQQAPPPSRPRSASLIHTGHASPTANCHCDCCRYPDCRLSPTRFNEILLGGMDSQSIATAIYGWMDQSTRPWSHIPASLPSTATAAFEGREAVCTTLLALIRKIGTIPDWRAQDLTGRVFHSAIWLGVFKLSDGFLSSILLLLPSLLQYILHHVLAISPNSTFNSINNTYISIQSLSVRCNITKMAPVGPRASKEEFMQALGLNSHDPQHEQHYRAMRVRPPNPPSPPTKTQNSKVILSIFIHQSTG